MNTPPISIEALLVLDAIEHRGSYAAAAEQLNKVPSALSYIVNKLEEQLNVTLFQRQGRRAVLTPAGKHLLTEGRKVLNAINNLSEQTQTIANGWEPRIRIAYDSIFDISDVFKNLQLFLNEHKNIEIDIKEEVLNGTWEALIEDDVDLVIGAPAPVPNQKGIRAVKIADIQNVLVVHPSHPLALLKTPTEPSELGQYTTVIVHDSAKQGIPWSANLIEGNQRFYVSSVSQKITAILSAIGIGYLPVNLITEHIKANKLHVVELTEPRPTQDLYLAWKITNKGKGLKQLTQIILNSV
ncbi:LysR substrate-binding domain-containing protein [Pseudoalteromonas sp. US3C1013]|uniref:LysR substrate-binding domain-containing protein n=1 Tax=unclassified Pseudoalteromonas TaxID=194690 RepID=UPI003AB60DF6